MKTTVNLPDDLVNSVKKLYPGVTKTVLIVMGLKELEFKKALEDFKEYRGKVSFEKPNSKTLRGREKRNWISNRSS